MRGRVGTFRGDLLIDGYNLLHAAGLARRTYGPGEFDRLRRRLIKLLAGQLSERERDRTTVVFDAPGSAVAGAPLASPPSEWNGILVIFAEGDGDADAAIERLIRQNSAPRRLHVISSDHRLQRAARRRRARFLDSETFLARIARRPSPDERAANSEPPEKREGLTSPGDVDAWLRTFADVQDVHDPDRAAPKPVGRHQDHSPPSRSDVESISDSPPLNATEDVAFWERRIAELWDQADESP